jgi:hypothetical protein
MKSSGFIFLKMIKLLDNLSDMPIVEIKNLYENKLNLDKLKFILKKTQEQYDQIELDYFLFMKKSSKDFFIDFDNKIRDKKSEIEQTIAYLEINGWALEQNPKVQKGFFLNLYHRIINYVDTHDVVKARQYYLKQQLKTLIDEKIAIEIEKDRQSLRWIQKYQEKMFSLKDEKLEKSSLIKQINKDIKKISKIDNSNLFIIKSWLSDKLLNNEFIQTKLFEPETMGGFKFNRKNWRDDIFLAQKLPWLNEYMCKILDELILEICKKT